VDHPVDPRQPVLVGIGVATQRVDAPEDAREPLDLMLDAVRRAGTDAGGAQALAGVQRIAVPKGRWRYRNPAGEIAQAIGAHGAQTVLANLGVLQQTLIGDACARIASGEIDSALVVGGDAGYRILRAKLAGRRAGERQQEQPPDLVLDAAEDLLHPAELAAGIRLPAPLYAILSSAWRAAHGLSPAAHRQAIAGLYEGFARVSAQNPDSWQRREIDAARIAEASERNPMQAFPYTRLHCSSWNVDQAAALLICSAGRAEALDIPRARWVHAWASSESNHVVPVSARAQLACCAGARLAGHAVLQAGGLRADEIDLVDLYSCFPIAVEMTAKEIGLALHAERPPTLTGGMSFAGGPFNNYVLQSTCRMAALMRAGQGGTGLVSCVSGVLNKVGFGLWAREPGPTAFRSIDVTAEVAVTTGTMAVVQHHEGRGRVAGYTVVHERDEAPRALVLAETDSGTRTLALNADPALVQRLEGDEFCGAAVRLSAGGFAPA
jgi:acetyl-CoA C-acetyltransferase